MSIPPSGSVQPPANGAIATHTLPKREDDADDARPDLQGGPSQQPDHRPAAETPGVPQATQPPHQAAQAPQPPAVSLPLNRFPLPGLSLPTDFQPILQDHHSVLYPNYTSPFTSAHDVVVRLLPWHVWQVPQDVIALAKGQQFVSESVKGKAKAVDNSQAHSLEAAPAVKTRKRKRWFQQYGQDVTDVPAIDKAGCSSQVTFERIQGLEYPDAAELEELMPRYEGIRARVAKIRHAAVGGLPAPPQADEQDHVTAPALFARESHQQLLRRFHNEEKAELDQLLADLKQSRFNMMAQYGGTWQTELDRIAPGLPPVPRDELYNPPPPSPPPVKKVSPPTIPILSRSVATPSTPATPREPHTPQAAAGAPVQRRASRGGSPPASKSQSPAARQQSPPQNAASATTNASGGARGRKRSSITPGARQSAAQSPAAQAVGPAAASAARPPPPVRPAQAPHAASHTPVPTPRPAVPGPRIPAQSPSAPPHGRSLSAASNHASQNRPTVPAPHTAVPERPPPAMGIPRPAASAMNGSSAANQVPIRVVLPLNLIQTLTDAGVAPQPAPHLKPAIEAHKRRAAAAAAQGASAPPLVSNGAGGEDSPTGGYSTAPCDPDPSQVHAAVLLGITEAMSPHNHAERYQLVHLSLKLDRLAPNQLQALADAVNAVQGQQAAAGDNSGVVGMMGMQPPTSAPNNSRFSPSVNSPGSSSSISRPLPQQADGNIAPAASKALPQMPRSTPQVPQPIRPPHVATSAPKPQSPVQVRPPGAPATSQPPPSS